MGADHTAFPEGHSLIVGASGAGKTVTAKGEVERLLREERHVAIIDPTGVWHGLRAASDGEGEGFAIPIFGGLHGDVPIHAEQGAKVGEIIAGGVSAILDLSQMDSPDQHQFVLELISALRRKPKGNFHLIVDEADEFAPQTSPSTMGEQAKRQMEWIAKRGRVQGFVLMAITQRPADIAKSVISQMQVVVAHQLIAPADQNAVKSYLKDNADKLTLATVMESLAGLDRGERWIYAPRMGVLERGVSPLPETFDTSRTPEPGEAAAEPTRLTEIDLGAIREALKCVDQEGEGAPAAHGAKEQIAKLQAENARLRAAVDEAETRGRSMGIAIGIQRARSAIDRVSDEPEPEGASYTKCEQSLRAPADGKNSDDLTNGAKKLLTALIENHPRPMPIEHVAKLAGVSVLSSQWPANERSLRSSADVDVTDGGMWKLSTTGIARYGVAEQPDDPSALLRFWRDAFTPSTGEMLSVLVKAEGAILSRDEVADRAGVSRTSSGLGGGLRELRMNKLIIETDRGYRAAEVLLP